MSSLEGAIAVTRFGLGARRGEIETASRDPKAWLVAQLNAKPPYDNIFNELLGSRHIFTVSRDYKTLRDNISDTEQAAASTAYGKLVRRNFETEIYARAVYAARTENPFHERLTRFWSNHFSISARNRSTRLYPGAYEREAIRPNILGSFYELARHAIFHQGMLVFLDNTSSTGPRSRKGIRQDKGLNENLAREVLELHTVTPAAGYTQTDVTEFAKALTGWRLETKRNTRAPFGSVVFKDFSHEPGKRKVLGEKYPKGLFGSWESQAPQILKDLCMRPETASNIARKLATHFVSDNPPDALVKTLRDTFLETEGDLTALYTALIHSPHAWQPEAQKIKTPEELLVSTARVIGLEETFTKNPKTTYDSLAQIPFTAPTPEGWPDTAQAWLGPDALLKRIEWAGEMSSKQVDVDARDILIEALGARVSNATIEAVERAESGQQALVLAIMSPEFQRR